MKPLTLRERLAARLMTEHVAAILQPGIDDAEQAARCQRAAVVSVRLADLMIAELVRELAPKPPPPGTKLPCRDCGELKLEWESLWNTCAECREKAGVR